MLEIPVAAVDSFLVFPGSFQSPHNSFFFLLFFSCLLDSLQTHTSFNCSQVSDVTVHYVTLWLMAMTPFSRLTLLFKPFTHTVCCHFRLY